MHGKYIPQLDGIRAVAIGLVFLFHSPWRFKGGWVGVDLFFVLSGFLITRILADRKGMPIGQYFSTFYERRARRILPPYVLLMVVTSVVFGFSWLSGWYMFLGLMNFWHSGPASLGALWSLAVEEQFYLVWPLLVLFVPRKRLPLVAICLIATAPVLRGVLTPIVHNQWAIYKQTPCRMDCLAMGALIALASEANQARLARIGALWLAPAGVGLGALLCLSKKSGFSTADMTIKANVLTYELSLLAVTAVFLWALSDKATGILKWGPIRWIGQISYSLYLIQQTIYAIVERHFNGKLEVTGTAVVLCVLYSAVSLYCVERPIMSARRQRPTARDPATAGLRNLTTEPT